MSEQKTVSSTTLKINKYCRCCLEMSIICQTNNYVIISHEEYLNLLYSKVLEDGVMQTYLVKSEFFMIINPFKNEKCKRKKFPLDVEAEKIKNSYNCIKDTVKDNFTSIVINNAAINALKAAQDFYALSAKFESFTGGNTHFSNIVALVNGREYLVPKKCRFYNNDINQIQALITETFNFIILDPPWWNKYIRRKRAWNDNEGYKMMWDKDLASLPIKSLLSEDTLVAVWCTNAMSHIEAVRSEFFPQWGVSYLATWIWLKVTKKGEPVTPFAHKNGKQPYERIIFGTANPLGKFTEFPKDKLIISVPSAVHSHKPPLIEVLKPYLPDDPRCLEIFARYLLPNFVSYGNEVLKLQDMTLFVKR